MWRISPSNRFRKILRKIKKGNPALANRIEDAILQLKNSERPELHGFAKRGPLSGYYAWEFGRKCRLLYSPDYDERVLVLSRVCSHKQVYDR